MVVLAGVVQPVQVTAEPVDAHHRAVQDAQPVAVAGQPPQRRGQRRCRRGEQVDRLPHIAAVASPTPNPSAGRG